MSLPHEIFVDGGCIGRNPSKHGGTWCYCWVDEKGRAMDTHASGLILPSEHRMEAITNNYSELYAALMGLSSVPLNWNGTIYTDSKITMYRITSSNAFSGIPTHLKSKVLERRRGRRYKVAHVKGHPTKADLLKGANAKGDKVSKFNVFCDLECGILSREFMAAREAMKEINK